MKFNIYTHEIPATPMRVCAFLPNEGEPAPDDYAVLQALYSRSDKSIVDAAKEASEDKTRRLMDKYFIGYGHSSIGENAQIVLAFENVPMYAAMLFMHSHEYSGQARSTRYQDFSKPGTLYYSQNDFREINLDPFYDAYSTDGELSTTLRAAFQAQGHSPNASAAGTFDILRNYLPGGTLTSFSLSTNFTALRRLIARVENYIKAHQTTLPACTWLLNETLAHVADRVWPTSKIKVADNTMDSVIWEVHGAYDGFRIYGPASEPSLAMARGQLHMSLGSARDLFRHRSIKWAFPLIGNTSNNPLYVACYGIRHAGLPDETVTKLLRMADRPRERVIGSPWEAHRLGSQTIVDYYMPLAAFPYLHRTRTAPAVHYEVRRAVDWLAALISEDTGRFFLHLTEEQLMVIPPNSKRGDQVITEIKKG